MTCNQCPTEDELNQRVYYPTKIYPQSLPQQPCQPPYQHIPQQQVPYGQQPCHPQVTQVPYQQPTPCYPYQQPYNPYQQQAQPCQPSVKVRVLRACNGQWTLFQELTLSHPPSMGTIMTIDGGSYKIESLLLLGNDGGYDSYEALVIPALQNNYQAGPWTSTQKDDCGCLGTKRQSNGSKCSNGCGGQCGCSNKGRCGNTCDTTPYPVYALKGYPW